MWDFYRVVSIVDGEERGALVLMFGVTDRIFQ